MDLDLVIEKLNTLGESAYEYETSHVDAGNNYAHLPCESWTEYDDSRLAEYMQEKGINYDGLEIDAISDRVLDSFDMQASNAFGMGDGSFLVESYPVGEIEIQIQAEDLGIAEFTKEICESLSRSSDVFLRYDSRDSAFGYVDGSYDCWDCVISEKVLRGIVSDMQAES